MGLLQAIGGRVPGGQHGLQFGVAARAAEAVTGNRRVVVVCMVRFLLRSSGL